MRAHEQSGDLLDLPEATASLGDTTLHRPKEPAGSIAKARGPVASQVVVPTSRITILRDSPVGVRVKSALFLVPLQGCPPWANLAPPVCTT
jgi:hypothetical protein